MATWREMAMENRVTAKELLDTARFRGSINRSYYAAYCAVTSVLAGSVTFGYGNNNPTHNELPVFVINNLSGVGRSDRYKIRKAIVNLLKARSDADYVPAAVIGEREALEAVREMGNVFRLLEIKDE